VVRQITAAFRNLVNLFPPTQCSQFIHDALGLRE
jgi:hypothetical protein